MKLAFAVVAAMSTMLTAFPVCAQNQQQDRLAQIPTLSVSGRGEVSLAPDLAVVRMGVTAQHKDAAAAQTAVNQSMQSVLQAIRQSGVAANDIQTSSLSLYPEYSHSPRGEQANQPPVISSYRSEIMVTVKLRDLNRVGQVVDAGLKAGANQFQGVSFELLNDTNAKAQALQQAVRSAQEKARATAEALGVRLEHIVEVVEGGTDFVRPMYEGRAAMMDMGGSPNTPIEAGQVQVSANLTLRYRISGGGLPQAQNQPDGAVAPTPRRRMDPISAPPPTIR